MLLIHEKSHAIQSNAMLKSHMPCHHVHAKQCNPATLCKRHDIKPAHPLQQRNCINPSHVFIFPKNPSRSNSSSYCLSSHSSPNSSRKPFFPFSLSAPVASTASFSSMRSTSSLLLLGGGGKADGSLLSALTLKRSRIWSVCMLPRPAFCWFTTVEATSILKRWRLEFELA
jgi:hypothetical protein